MRQMSLAQQAEFQRFAKKSRREQFLETMDAVMPWAELLALVEPHYPKGKAVRRWAWASCFGFTSCSTGLPCRTLGPRMRSMIRRRCAVLWVSTWAGLRRRTRPRS